MLFVKVMLVLILLGIALILAHVMDLLDIVADVDVKLYEVEAKLSELKLQKYILQDGTLEPIEIVEVEDEE